MIRAELQSKHPHTTFWLIVMSETKLPPKLTKDLEKIGWKFDDKLTLVPPPGEPIQHVFGNPGTGLFNGWTDQERKEKLKPVQALMKEWCINLGVRKMTAQDLA